MEYIKKFTEECNEEIKKQGNDSEMLDLSQHWITAANNHKYSYHFNWLGRPIIQYPQDIIAMQEIIWTVKPDLIIETGIAHGGSLIFYASLLALMDMIDASAINQPLHLSQLQRKVIGIDIDIRSHNRIAIENHPLFPLIELIQGSSTDTNIVRKVKLLSKNYKKVLVCLDSNHTHEHVLAELNAYAQLTSIGSYCVVFDTIIDDLPTGIFPNRPWGPGNNPKTAVREFLETHHTFKIDRSIQEKLLITVAPDGYLKRVR